MKLIQIDNWRDYRRDGDQFLKTALGAYTKKKKAFSADTLFANGNRRHEELSLHFCRIRYSAFRAYRAGTQ